MTTETINQKSKMDWLTHKTHTRELTTKTITVSTKTKAAGIKILMQEGFQQCNNNSYYENEDKIVHWNKIVKRWRLYPK